MQQYIRLGWKGLPGTNCPTLLWKGVTYVRKKFYNGRGRWNSPADNGAHIQQYILEFDDGRGKYLGQQQPFPEYGDQNYDFYNRVQQDDHDKVTGVVVATLGPNKLECCNTWTGKTFQGQAL